METSRQYENMFIIRKMISDRENNFIQIACNKWLKYRNVQPNYKNENMRSSAINSVPLC